MSGISNQIAIAGVGYSRQGTLPGSTPMSLLVEATKNALADAGITKDQIDGLYTMPGTTSPEGAMHYLAVGQTLGIDPAVTGTFVMGGGSAGACVQAAAMAIHAGLATTVLCVMGETARTGGMRFSGASGGGDSWGLWGFFSACANSATTASRHMALYGTKSEHLGNVAVANRLHASKNPDAIMRTPITLEDHQNSRWIVRPLHLLDCCLISDGAVAYVVTSVERARDMKQKVVTIAGMGQGYTTRNLDREDWWYVPHQKDALDKAFKMAGVTPKDIDVAQLYDNFTISVILWLEHAGFCKVGEGGPFTEGGRIQIGGELPVNTAGGNHSESYMEGWLHVVEGVKQMRGTSHNQVKDAKHCLVTGRGLTLNCANGMILRAA